MGLLEKERKYRVSLDLVQDYIDKIYTMTVQKDMDTLKKSVYERIEKIKVAAKRKNASKTTLSPLVDEFIKELTEFDNIMQPIQLSTQRRGLEHSDSREMAREVRSLAVFLSNTLEDLSLTEKIVQTGKRLFAEVSSAEQAFSEDIDTIFELKESQKKRDADITYSVENPYTWDHRKMHISPKGIVYGNTHIKLEDIT